MFRPQDSHGLRLPGASPTISPPAASIRRLHDVFGNSINYGFACAGQLAGKKTGRS